MSNIHRLNNIVTFKPANFPPLAFHTENLEIAEISEELFASICNQTFLNSETQNQFKEWDHSENTEPALSSNPAKVQSLTINVTQLCNLKCTYCAAGGDGTFGDPVKKISIEKTLPQIQFFLDKLKESDSFTISFLGGEPLLYPDSLEIIFEFINDYQTHRAIKPRFHLTTNGTLINKETLKILKKMKADITISLDGPKEINDLTRPNKTNLGVTDLIQDNLKKILLERDQLGTIGVSGVYNQFNMNVFESFIFFRSLNVDWYEFNFDHIHHDSETSQKYCFEMKRVAETAFKIGGEKELRKIKSFSHYFKLLENQQKVHNFCGAGKSTLMIDARNNIYPCPWMVGDKEEQIGEDLHINQLRLESFQPSIIETNNCHQCWAKYLCGGGCMFIHKSHTGSKNKVSETFCERTRFMAKLSIEYFFRSRSINIIEPNKYKQHEGTLDEQLREE
jgi:uncharacterized protein